MGVKRGYKQTDIGIVPSNWNVVRIGDVFRVLRSGSNTRDELTTFGEVKYLHYGDIHTRWRYFLDMSREDIPYIDLDRVEHLPNVQNGDLVIADASEDNEGLGASIEVRNVDQQRVVAGLHTFLLRGDARHLADGFKGYLQAFHWFRNSVVRTATGVSVYGLSRESLLSIKLPLPPLAEQRAIAEVLSDMDAQIAALDALIAKKRDIKQGAMQELLTGRRRLPGFTGAWTQIEFAEHSILKARIGWQGLTTNEYLASGEYFLVTGTDFKEGKICWDTCSFVDRSRYIQDKNIQLQSGDVLITKDGTIGKVAYVDNLLGASTLNSGVFVIRPKQSDYMPHFLYYVFNSSIFETFLHQLSAGSTINHLYQKYFSNYSAITTFWLITVDNRPLCSGFWS